MKRLLTIVAHVGLVLIALSSAFYLVSLIPQGDWGLKEVGRKTLSPQTCIILYIPPESRQGQPAKLLNPQTLVRIILKTNGTLSIRLFNNNYNDIKWLNNKNTTVLDAFVKSDSSRLTLEKTVSANGNFTFEYVPPKIENATVIVANPTSLPVRFDYTSRTIIVVASAERIFLALMICVPLGAVLTVPWVAYRFKEKLAIKKNATSPSS